MDNDTRLATLETRLTGIEASVQQLIADIRNRGHIPWAAVITAAGGFAGALLWVVTTQTGPISKDLDQRAATLANEIAQRTGNLGRDLDRTAGLLDKIDMRGSKADEIINARIDKLSDTISSKFVGREDLNSRFDALNTRFELGGARRDDWQKITDSRLDREIKMIEKLQDAVVPRGEHEQHWAGATRQFTEVQRQLDDQRTRLNDLFSAKDVIRDDHDAIRKIESELARLIKP